MPLFRNNGLLLLGIQVSDTTVLNAPSFRLVERKVSFCCKRDYEVDD